WILHGFYNGDTVTFVSLVQKSLLNPDTLPTNPFAAQTALEYPTLLHQSMAGFLRMWGMGLDWIYFLPTLTYIWICLTVSMMFLWWDILLPEPKDNLRLWLGVPKRWMILLGQVVVSFLVMSLSFDAFVYPQSHFFLFGLFLLGLAF